MGAKACRCWGGAWLAYGGVVSVRGVVSLWGVVSIVVKRRIHHKMHQLALISMGVFRHTLNSYKDMCDHTEEVVVVVVVVVIVVVVLLLLLLLLFLFKSGTLVIKFNQIYI